MRAIALVSLSVLLLTSVALAATPQRLLGIGAEGGDLRVFLSDGQVLHGRDLVGATLDIGTAGNRMALRIDSAERDTHPQAPDVWLFALTIVEPGAPDRPFCMNDPDGKSLAIPYPTPTGTTLTCSSGAVGKCFRFGYRPWANAPDGTSMAPLHEACTRMVRADYGGDDRPWTRNGMTIDLYDDHGIQHTDPSDTMPFEAGWSPSGAVCVAHVRVPENGALADMVKAEPRLAGRTGPAACTEQSARASGALIFNRSRAE